MTPTEYRATASEAEVQVAIVRGLTWAGYTVLVTSRQRKRCAHCGQVSHGGDGCSEGIADLLCRRREWPIGVWCALEVKNARGRPSRIQQALIDANGYRIVRSYDEALMVLEAADRAIREER